MYWWTWMTNIDQSSTYSKSDWNQGNGQQSLFETIERERQRNSEENSCNVIHNMCTPNICETMSLYIDYSNQRRPKMSWKCAVWKLYGSNFVSLENSWNDGKKDTELIVLSQNSRKCGKFFVTLLIKRRCFILIPEMTCTHTLSYNRLFQTIIITIVCIMVLCLTIWPSPSKNEFS